MGTEPIITRSIKPPPRDILVRWNPTAFFSVSRSEIEAMLEIMLPGICHTVEMETRIMQRTLFMFFGDIFNTGCIFFKAGMRWCPFIYFLAEKDLWV